MGSFSHRYWLGLRSQVPGSSALLVTFWPSWGKKKNLKQLALMIGEIPTLLLIVSVSHAKPGVQDPGD